MRLTDEEPRGAEGSAIRCGTGYGVYGGPTASAPYYILVEKFAASCAGVIFAPILFIIGSPLPVSPILTSGSRDFAGLGICVLGCPSVSNIWKDLACTGDSLAHRAPLSSSYVSMMSSTVNGSVLKFGANHIRQQPRFLLRLASNVVIFLVAHPPFWRNRAFVLRTQFFAP